MEHGVALLINSIDVSLGLFQYLDNLLIASHTCEEERGVTIGVLDVNSLP